MTKSTAVKNKPHNQYTPEFREQASALADTVGVAQAARELNLYESNVIRGVLKHVSRITVVNANNSSLPR